MKKILILVFTCAAVFFLFGCGKGNSAEGAKIPDAATLKKLDNWTAVENPGDFAVYGAAYGEASGAGSGRFIFGGLNGKMAYSDDGGATWESADDDPFWDHTVSTSLTTDGSSLHFPAPKAPDGSYYRKAIMHIAHDGKKRFVAGASYGSGGVIAYSDDGGATWTAAPTGDVFRGGPRFVFIVYANDRFFALGGSGERMGYSRDGVAWTAMEKPVELLRGIAYGNNRFIAVGDKGQMAHSNDGIYWTPVRSDAFGTAIDITSIAYGNKRFVAGGAHGRIAYSSDGITWTVAEDSAFGANKINAIAYALGCFVAVGEKGKMAYSIDGRVWTAVTDNTFGELRIKTIVYGNGSWIAVHTPSPGASKIAVCAWP